jgi:transcriptional regulator with XRE-family HTH domain
MSIDIGKNIKTLRKQRGFLQKQVAEAIKIYPSNYSKIEKGERQPTIDMLIALSKFFDVKIEDIIYLNNNPIEEQTSIEDKITSRQLELIQQLEKQDKEAVFRIIDVMLANKKLKDFVSQNLIT